MQYCIYNACPVVPRSIRVARKREIQANKDLYNLWEFPDTSHLLKDPLLTLMANGGKGPTKLRNEHKYKGDRESTSNKKMPKSFSTTNMHSKGKWQILIGSSGGMKTVSVWIAWHIILPIGHDFCWGAFILKIGSWRVPQRAMQLFSSLRSRSPITDSLDFC